MNTPLAQTTFVVGRIPARQRGTTLIELMVALALFLVVAGAAFALFNQQQVATSTLQGQVGLSLSLRNAASQLQLDLANAGSGYFQGVNVPTWPVGVTIVNNWVNYGSSCYSSTTGYGANCFDQLNIITANPGGQYPPVHATNSAGSTTATVCPQTYNGSPGSATTVYALNANGLTLAQTAAKFVQGDQLLFLTGSGKAMTTATLAANGAVSGSAVALSIYQTEIDGSNILGNDPLDITSCDRTSLTSAGSAGTPIVPTSPACPPPPPVTTPPTPPSVTFGTNYCSADWIIKLSPITYSVAANSDTTNPWQLVRTQNGTTSVVMDQILGFKVGASIWDVDVLCGYTTPCYNYQTSTYAIGNAPSGSAAWNFSLIRSVRASLIGRTTPNYSSQYTYRNTFDGGPYQVQGTAIVVNPRNMSMNDDQTLPNP
jgi:prepilin-type N-terminal cleavage/methylation domain-containing protein